MNFETVKKIGKVKRFSVNQEREYNVLQGYNIISKVKETIEDTIIEILDYEVLDDCVRFVFDMGDYEKIVRFYYDNCEWKIKWLDRWSRNFKVESVLGGAKLVTQVFNGFEFLTLDKRLDVIEYQTRKQRMINRVNDIGDYFRIIYIDMKDGRFKSYISLMKIYCNGSPTLDPNISIEKLDMLMKDLNDLLRLENEL